MKTDTPKPLPHYFQDLGLHEDPFATTPDPAFFCPTAAQKSILVNLEISIRLRRGVSVVLGEIGTGKTTLCRALLQKLALDASIETHLLLNPDCETEKDLLATVARLFKIWSGTRNDTSAHIKNYLLEKGLNQNQTLVLIVDEAQKLSLDGIEALRGLLNFETNEHKLLQLILFGQLELKDKLKAMPNFLDRVNYKQQLLPLTLEECQELIQYRVHLAGRDYSLFTHGALKTLHELTGGFPRKICILAHRVLQHLVNHRQNMADESLIRELWKQEQIFA